MSRPRNPAVVTSFVGGVAALHTNPVADKAAPEHLEATLAHLPSVPMAFAYGSGVFQQTNHSSKKVGLI